MFKLLIIIGVLLAVVAVIELLRGKGVDLPKYRYKRKQFFMSRAEHECFEALMTAVGNEYHIFPQVHLPTIIDNKVKGQNWNAAFRHVSQKSVDFVLCNKRYIEPILAIELDDQTHNRQDRKDRDGEVERILKDAGLPLLRLENHGQFDPQELSKRISEVLSADTTRN